MNAEELETFAQSLPGARADRPFEEDFETIVFRHTENGKWFGVLLAAPARIFGKEGSVKVLNLKCPPDLAEIFRVRYRSVVPAYHMNKRLWISTEIQIGRASCRERVCSTV